MRLWFKPREVVTVEPPKKKNPGRPFVKGDARINRKGRIDKKPEPPTIVVGGRADCWCDKLAKGSFTARFGASAALVEAEEAGSRPHASSCPRYMDQDEGSWVAPPGESTTQSVAAGLQSELAEGDAADAQRDEGQGTHRQDGGHLISAGSV